MRSTGAWGCAYSHGLAERHDGLVAQGAQQGQLFFVQWQQAFFGLNSIDQAEGLAFDDQGQQQKGGRVDVAAVPGG